MKPKRLPQNFDEYRAKAKAEAEPPDPARYVPEGMIRLRNVAYEFEGIMGSRLLAPAGHPVYPTLIDVEQATVTSDDGQTILGTVHWATPEAVAQSAAIYATHLARGEQLTAPLAPAAKKKATRKRPA